MQQMGYDAVTIGDREFLLGFTRFTKMADDSGPAILLSNIKNADHNENRSLGPDFFIKEFNNIKVGVFALIHRKILKKGKHKTEKLKAEDVFLTAKRVVSTLKEKKCSIIVLLAQMEPFLVKKLTQEIPSITVAVLGYHPGLRTSYRMINNTVFIQPGIKGKHLGQLNIEVNSEGSLVCFKGRSIPLDDKIKKDQAVLDAIDTFTDTFEED